jgi:hypothetical protein
MANNIKNILPTSTTESTKDGSSIIPETKHTGHAHQHHHAPETAEQRVEELKEFAKAKSEELNDNFMRLHDGKMG